MSSQPNNADRNEDPQTSTPTQPNPTRTSFLERSPLQEAMPSIADAFLQYFVEHKQVEKNLAEADVEQVHNIESPLRETEFSYLKDLLALLQDFQNNDNAGLDRSYIDTTQSLQSLIDRCTANVAKGDALESFKLAEDLLAWLVWGAAVEKSEMRRRRTCWCI